MSFMVHRFSSFSRGTRCFVTRPLPGDTWRVEDDHLAQMMELTGEYFSRKVLKKCRKRDEYFDETGQNTLACFSINLIPFLQESYGASTNYPQ